MTFSDDAETFKRFIRFIYSDTVRLSAAQAPAMRTLAQKLNMPQLEAICESIQQPTVRLFGALCLLTW